MADNHIEAIFVYNGVVQLSLEIFDLDISTRMQIHVRISH